MRFTLFLLGLLWFLMPPVLADPSTERKIEALLGQMTLEEKLGQLQMLDGDANGEYRPEHLSLVRQGLLGSTLNVRTPDRVNRLQRIAVEESRLKIPVLFAFDVIHGYRTIFPVPLAEAATWDPKAVEKGAQVAAREAAADGLKWTFAPMVDVARDARWGRVVESSGEDPFLGAVLAEARVRGFQGDDPAQSDRVLACAKHWVAYGAAEAGRDYNTVDVSERSLREVYFPPFKACVDAGVGTFMSAFNDLGGVPTSGNPQTLTFVLRGEWKWDGVVVSDYESVRELINHRFAADDPEAARIGLSAGVDIEMVSRLYNRHLPAWIQAGKFPQAVVDEAVRRVLRLKFRAGLFDRPYADPAAPQRWFLHPDHRATARRIAAASLVLLKNEGELLPLSKNIRTLAVVGPLADDPRAVIGSWSGDGKPEDAVSLLQGIGGAVSPGTRVLHAKGVPIEGRGVTGNHDAVEDPSNAGGTNVTGTGGVDPARLATTPAEGGLERAVQAAREADAVLVVVGETAEMSGEAASRSSLDLPGRQLELVQAIHATGKPYAVVLMNGRPLALPWIAENSPAILETWFAGTEAGNGIADVLFGDVNPSGKLPVTFPRAVGQVPLYYSHKSTGRPPGQGKYTSKYLDVPVTPLYPFGHGLSYTRFELTDLRLSAPRIPHDGSLTASVLLKNAGTRTGTEVVQLYVQDMASSVTRPVQELRGFERVTLTPGQQRRVSFRLGPEQLGFYGRDMEFFVEPGWFQVQVGTSSAEGLVDRFEVAGE
ncbi:MAG: beta-glucosidase BglX [Armatimonadetes bacterium]|nr:beta-glucosidase BglX [Armatimonadota bacterium]